MILISKLKETVISIIPVVIIILLLNFTIAPLETVTIIEFLVGAVLTILGLTLFLLGAEVGILPIGEKAGAALTSKKNLPILLIASFVIGFMITIAEPDVQVLALQVTSVDQEINKTILVVMIAIGVGLFVSIGLLRTMLKIPIKYLFTGFYLIVFIIAIFTPKEYLAVAFDAGGATTGPMTVPFILALGMGVAAVRGKSKATGTGSEDSFGLTGMASIGPILAVLLLGLIMSFSFNSTQASTTNKTEIVQNEQIISEVNDNTEIVNKNSHNIKDSVFFEIFPEMLVEVLKALLPLIIMFIVFQFFLLHLTSRQLIKISIGLVYAYIGLVLFMTGVNGGFIPVGDKIGSLIGVFKYKYLLILIGVILGAVVVCAEPAVWVLTKQVEEISGGTIKRSVLLLTLSTGVALAVGLAMLRVIVQFSLWYILIPGYLLALILSFFCPKLFTAIAFDSGGVASGPMTSTFILSFTLGAAKATGGNPLIDAFGVIALVALAPLIAIQILGLIYSKKGRSE